MLISVCDHSHFVATMLYKKRSFCACGESLEMSRFREGRTSKATSSLNELYDALDKTVTGLVRVEPLTEVFFHRAGFSSACPGYSFASGEHSPIIAESRTSSPKATLILPYYGTGEYKVGASVREVGASRSALLIISDRWSGSTADYGGYIANFEACDLLDTVRELKPGLDSLPDALVISLGSPLSRGLFSTVKTTEVFSRVTEDQRPLLAAAETVKLSVASIVAQCIDAQGGLSIRQKKLVQAACLRMEHRLGQELRMTDIARELGVSLRYLELSFLAVLETSPKKWLMNRRLELAYTWLQTREMTITEIVYALCFSSQSAFGVAFKNRFGVTPSSLKKARDA